LVVLEKMLKALDKGGVEPFSSRIQAARSMIIK
jgi:hypothetical protein